MSLASTLLRFLQEEHDDEHMDEDHHEEESSASKPWGDVILACFLVQLVTLSGVVFFTGVHLCSRKFNTSSSFLHRLQHQIIPSFGCGALLATAVFLLVPESFHLLSGGHEAHSEEQHQEEEGHEGHNHRLLQAEEDTSYVWKFGAALLGGFLLPILVGAIFPPPDTSDCPECQQLRQELTRVTELPEQDEDQADDTFEIEGDEVVDSIKNRETKNHPVVDESGPTKDVVEEKPVKHHSRNITLASSILFGDALHNFTDGIFLGNAFLLCDKAVAWTIVATTIYHELAQEIADYGLLVHHCGLTRCEAVSLNFVSGFSIMIGAVIILALDLSNLAIGIIMAISAGVYLYISASECIPRIQATRKAVCDTFSFLLWFVLGAVPIGLVLLNHSHCEGEGHEEHR